MSVVVQIDTLALPGLSGAAARRAAEVFASELEALLATRGLPEGVRPEALERVDLGTLPVAATSPEGIGRALARALYDRVVS